VREAAHNAGRHSGVAEVSVYVEVEPQRVTAFVRDRGRGFDLEAVEPGRVGVRESIIGRMARHGGRAEVHTGPDEGTEVVLEVGRTPVREGAS
jgi:signal transduction histidine kinase